VIILGQGATHIPVRSLWLLLIYASELLAQLRSEERDALLSGKRDNDLIDAIAEVLAVEVERRLRRELTVHYRPRRADLTRVRGRIEHLRTTTRRLSDQGRIACQFDELSVDSPRNRFIANTLLLSARAIIRPELAHRCRAAAFRMHRLGVSASAPSRAELSTDRLGHHDVADRRMLDAATLLRDMAVPAHEAGPVNLPVLREDFGTHRKLFEAAVRGFFRYRLSNLGWDVQARILRWTPTEQTESPFLPVMRTDITLDHPASGRRVIVETKFTDALVDRAGKTTVATGYLYQLYAYLASQTGRGSESSDTAAGVLLFVKTADRGLFDSEVIIQGHRIRFLSVDLTGSPADIRARWMQCIPD
jgi:5-methylcytosine-specific restriction enzyme subunit McrC